MKTRTDISWMFCAELGESGRRQSSRNLKQNMDKAYIRTSWRRRDADRRESWAKLVQSQNYKQEFNRVAKPEQDSARYTKQSDYYYYKQLADQINRSGHGLSQDFDRER